MRNMFLICFTVDTYAREAGECLHAWPRANGYAFCPIKLVTLQEDLGKKTRVKFAKKNITNNNY